MSETVTLVKARLGIAEVVGSYIKLEKAGANFRARCPFHNERTPSFFVSPARNSYYCFGCNRGGDIFSFVQDVEGVDFFESLKLLAARAGVSVTFENPEARGERARLVSVMNSATTFYESELAKAPQVIEYLTKRGLTAETIKSFRIGFAPNDWRKTEEALLAKGFTKAEIAKAGLLVSGTKKDGTPITYDRFRNRIMFPLADSSGTVVAFSGRVFGEEGEGIAKYVNSPETPLYSKSDLLFGYDRAKQAIREKGFAIVVEGQMDLILSHQAGFTNTVAVSGTALTERHLALIARMADTVYFSFDADNAGEKALLRSAAIALPAGLTVKAIAIEGGKDPADVVLSGIEKWKELVAGAQPIIEYAITLCEKKNTNATGEFNRNGFTKSVYETVLPLVARIENKIEEGRYIEIVAARLHIPSINVLEELKKIIARINEAPRTQPAFATAENTPLPRDKILVRDLLGIYFWQKSTELPITPADDIIEKLEMVLGKEKTASALSEIDDTLRARLSMQAEVWYKGNADLSKIIAEFATFIEIEQVKTSLISAIERLRLAEKKEDPALIQKELALCQSLSQKLTELKKIT
jgi:DNA primase